MCASGAWHKSLRYHNVAILEKADDIRGSHLVRQRRQFSMAGAAMSLGPKSKLDGCTGKAERLRISRGARFLRHSPTWHVDITH